MEKIVVKLHSFIDIITNSSTEIYTNADTKSVETMYGILSDILKVGGIETDPKELFDVYLESDCYPDNEDCDRGKTRIVTDKKEIERIYEHSTYYENPRSGLSLVVKDKSGKYGDIMTRIWKMFDQQASYDG